MTSLNEQLERARPPNGQLFDEVSIRTVPRYKTSQLSGDEWRIRAVVEIKYKGIVLHEQQFQNAQDAALFLSSCVNNVQDKFIARDQFMGFCDQEGCSEMVVNTYKLKDVTCNRCDQVLQHFEMNKCRRFCENHSRRGNCGIGDADSNYILVDGPGAQVMREQDISRARLIVASYLGVSPPHFSHFEE